MFDRIIKTIGIFLLSIALVQPSYALSIENVLQPRDLEQNYIVDLANVLDKDTETELNRAIAILEKNKNNRTYANCFH